MRKPLVAGNWKMNGSRSSISALVDGLLNGIGGVKNADVVVCPPAIYIPEVASMLEGSSIAWGSQDVAKEESGAYTGEIAVSMLRDFACTYAIVGHSERRTLYGDTDQVVAAKYARAQSGGLIPILCVGELLEERQAGTTESVVERQLNAIVSANGVESLSKAVIAYEPVWAIGTGMTASPEQAQEVHSFIRTWVSSRSKKIADSLQVLYGGSVKGNNAAELFAQDDIDGGLIGGASLNADEFLKICESAR